MFACGREAAQSIRAQTFEVNDRGLFMDLQEVSQAIEVNVAHPDQLSKGLRDGGLRQLPVQLGDSMAHTTTAVSAGSLFSDSVNSSLDSTE